MSDTATDTATALDKAKADLAAAQKAHDEAEATDKPRRAPYLIMLDFMAAVAGRFGHHPDLEALVREFKATVPPPPAAAPKEPDAPKP